VDNLARVNDLLSIGVSSDGSADKGRGTHGFNASWSVPLGNWRFSTSTYSSRYKQTIASNADTFASTGTSSNVDLAVERLLVRGQSYRSGIELRVAQRSSHSYVEGVEIEASAGVPPRSSWRCCTASAWGGSRQISAWRTAAACRGWEAMMTPWAATGADVPLWADHAGYRRRWRGIRAASAGMEHRAPLPVEQGHAVRLEFISVGGRYTVNGFDGEVPSRRQPWRYWRNSISWMAHRAIAPYAGIDIGHIERDDRQGIGGGTLSGAHLGARGELGGLAWDGFVGVPMSAPGVAQA
jgi:hemolysin activation/secretion protein